MQTWTLWDHQQDAVDRINEDWKSGINSICCQLCTGGGKSRIIRTIVDQWADKKKVVYVIAHRNTLVKQLSDELTEAGLQHGVIKAGSSYVRYRVQVCSMQTLIRRIDKLPEPSLIIVDECFPSSSIVTGSGEIQNIKIGDIVLSYDEKSNTMVNKKVLSTFKKELKDDLIYIVLNGNGELICTKNHPIMTNKGWVKAENIGVNDEILCSLRETNNKQQKNLFKGVSEYKKLSNNGKNKQEICKRQNAKKQSNEKFRIKGKDVKDFKRNKLETSGKRWKWSRNDKAPSNALRFIKRLWIYRRICNTNKNGKVFRLSYLLQSRLRESQIKASNRSRRWFSLCNKQTTARQKEGKLLSYIRVESCKIYKQGNAEWLRAMHGSNYVYNFEVEGTHTYVVNNCVVHNCHHLKSASYMKILDKWNRAKLLGMTATPQRPDGKSLESLFQVLEIGPSMKSLIERGSLCDYDYYAPENIDMSDVHKVAGDYNKKESQEKVDKTVITGNAIEHYKKYADHKSAICCCINIAHSEHVAQEFRDAGYKSVAVNSKMKPLEIQAAIDGLRNGKLEILTQCDMLGEGVDIKGAEVLIGLRPTSSLTIFLQHAGRVLRVAEGKDRAIILDHVGNWERFGLPSDDREWSLKGKPKKDKGKSKLKRCPDCLRPVPSSARACPYCGFQWVEVLEVGERKIEEKEGQLIAIKSVDKPQQQELIRAIACRAHNLKQAIAVAKAEGFDHRAGFTVWTMVLHHKKNDYVKF